MNSVNKIVNLYHPICRNCLHYRHFFYIDNISYQYKICDLFRHKDLINGKIEYMKALDCRMNKELCGLTGNYFNYKPKK
jgi:hypothetical protein